MAGENIRVTRAELAVLEVLWSGGSTTIRGITDALYPGGKNSDYATVQKLLDRLEAKGCVGRDRSSFRHRFRALVERDELVGQELREVASKLCEGSLTPLLLHLARDVRLSSRDRDQIRRLLEDSPEGRAS